MDQEHKGTKTKSVQLKKFIQGEFYKTFYDCQCGRSYDAFPALYLHFQRKHNKKISIKCKQNEFRTEQTGNKIIHTYFIQTNPNKEENIEGQFHIQLENYLEKVFSDFRNVITSEFLLQQRQCGCKILSLFHSFIENNLKCQTDDTKEQAVSEIPYFYNEFIFTTLRKEIPIEQYDILCRVFLRFTNWLREKGYSDLDVQYVGFKTKIQSW